MEKAAAFLETRRYAALLGATTEFSKMEYIAFNKKDRKFYLTISRVEAGMADTTGDIQVARNDGGIILEMSTAKGQKDTNGKPINSHFVGTKLASHPRLVGGWHGAGAIKDAEGNHAAGQTLRSGQPALCRFHPHAVHRRGHQPAQQPTSGHSTSRPASYRASSRYPWPRRPPA